MVESISFSRPNLAGTDALPIRYASGFAYHRFQSLFGRGFQTSSESYPGLANLVRVSGLIIPVSMPGVSIDVSSTHSASLSRIPPPPFYPDLGPTQDTRLIRIHPASDLDDDIVCTSKPVALHDEPYYIALSHSWGPNKPLKDIQLNGHAFPVRRPLYEALQALRQLGVEWVWIDKMSINQKDPVERERQLHKVRVIFSHAAQVIAWIGRQYDSDSDSAIFDAEFGVEFLGQSDFPSANWSEEEIMGVKAVAAREYWTRCWILQELCVARKATVLCGSTLADFGVFWTNIKRFFTQTALGYFHEDVRRHFMSLKDFQDQESAKSRLPRMPLVKAIIQSRHSKAFSMYDKIFAILSLAHDSPTLVDTPNYRQRIETIFWKLAHNMVHLQGHIAIILLARRAILSTEHNKPTDTSVTRAGPTRRGSRISVKDVDDFDSSNLPLPSWTPHWSELGEQPLPKWIEESVELDMDVKRPSPVVTTHEGHYGTVLGIRGVPLEYIVSTSGIPGSTRFNAAEPNNRHHGGTWLTSSQLHDNRYPWSYSTSPKQFAGPLDVIEKLWYAVIAPVFHDRNEKDLLHPIHECGDAGCRIINVKGVAVARVLLDSISTQVTSSENADSLRREIRDWMEINQNLMIGKKDLRGWLNAHLEHSNVNICHADPRRRVKNCVPRTPPCSFDREVRLLAEAFTVMRKNAMKLVVTSRGTFKLAFCEAHVGDLICRLDRVSLPVVLRPLSPDSSVMAEVYGHLIPLPQSRDPSPAPGRGVWTTPPLRQQSSSMDTSVGSLTDSVYLDASEGPEITTAPPPPPPSRDENTPTTYRFIGDVFLHYHYETEYAFENQSLTGWKQRHFSSEKWESLRIA